MTTEELKNKTKKVALRVIRLTATLPNSREAEVIGRQLLRSGTSVGANYRSACKARSKADFISKIGIVEEEADESLYWMELLMDSQIVKSEQMIPLHAEMKELTAIFTASGRTAKRNR
ncbi:MAG: four helix bundle protein [Ignavibacteria bacterium]|nr:four helix bundle protein [Ignavibacteria bacterium]MBI3766199.1 four helix bundle protein [Ignavibacteriales bacterium]